MRFNFFIAISVVAAKVVKLTDNDFLDMTKIGSKDQEAKWFVKFYAPWCPHCQRMAPEWDHMSEVVADDVQVAEVDVMQETKLRDKFDINGFPRMYLFDTDGKMYKYPGKREARAFQDFAEGGYKSETPVATMSGG